MKYITTIAILLAACLCGCSENVPLSGRITFEDNGEPLTMGTIAFIKGAEQSRSEIDSDGRYNLGFMKKGDGLPKGEYQIYIQAVRVETAKGPVNSDGDAEEIILGATPLIADKYKNPETSGLTFTADGKTKTFDIQVERPGR